VIEADSQLGERMFDELAPLVESIMT